MSNYPAPGLLIGRGRDDGHEYCWNPAEHRHLVIIGEPGTGKTTLAAGIAREAAVDFEANVWVAEPYRDGHSTAYAPLEGWLAGARFGDGAVALIADLATSGAQGYLVVEDPGAMNRGPGETLDSDLDEALDLAAKADGLHLVLVTRDIHRLNDFRLLGASGVTLGSIALRPGLANFHPGLVEPRVTVRPRWTSLEDIAESMRPLI